MALKGSQYF